MAGCTVLGRVLCEGRAVRFWAAESTNCRILTTNNTRNLNINILSINQGRNISFYAY
jgi:hypothetical protein